ncbi:MAG: amino acid adenylation domain-containing protein, partial [Flavobacteriaceae bacterium]
YRIELGEIQSQILLLNWIKEAHILTKTNQEGDKYLVAYIIEEKDLGNEAIMEALRKNLPDYMIPKVFIRMNQFPTTSNGKINVKALINIGKEISNVTEYLGANTEIEEKLVLLWEEHFKKERIGIRDDYFMMGGDSIKMISLVNKMNKAFACKIEVASFYRNPTIESFAIHLTTILEKENNDSSLQFSEIEKRLNELERSVKKEHKMASNIASVYPMSDIQLGMVATSELMRDRGEIGVYHDQFVHLLPNFDLDLLTKSLQLLVNKHEILRTFFDIHSYSEPVQITLKSISASIHFEDLSSLNLNEVKNHVGKFLTEERENKPFDFELAPLWRISLSKVDNSKSIFIIQFHHSILDGWSEKSLKIELFNIYQELIEDRDFKPVELLSSLSDSVVSDIFEKENQENIEYWKEKLSGYNRLNIFSNISQRAKLAKGYDSDFKNNLLEKCKIDNILPKDLFFSGYLYVLSMLTSKKDITVGIVTHRRPFVQDGDKLLGCFLNTIPFRLDISTLSNFSWSDYVKLISGELQELRGRDRLSLLDIGRANGETIENRNPFFDTVFNYVDFHNVKDLVDGENLFQSESNEELGQIANESFEVTNTFLDFSVSLTGDELWIITSATRELNTGHDLEDLVGYYTNFLNKYLNNSKEEISNNDIFSQKEREELLVEFNSTEVSYPKDVTALDLFKTQVDSNPANTALVYGDSNLSYGDLDHRSNVLAKELIDKGVKKSDLVAISMNRSLDMIVGVLGVLKSGAAYVPIDPSYPKDRISYILEDTSTSVLITNSSTIESLDVEDSIEVFTLDLMNFSVALEDYQALELTGEDLSYVIYTSGSTGRPKGVLLEHKALVNLMHNQVEKLKLSDKDNVLQFASIGFDAFAWELYATLFVGATLVIPDREDISDPKLLVNLMNLHEVTVATLPPTYQVMLQDYDFDHLRLIISAGEALILDVVQKFDLKGIKVINAYGPTENSVCSTMTSDSLISGNKVIIGKPIDNVEIYILDDGLNLLPIGVVGEICVSGKGLSRGYLNNEELTKEKFVSHPFKQGERMYRTGDLGRWLSDGTIEFVGRIDDQVKIRGYRIELGEIESCLSTLEGVNQSVVLVKEHGDSKHLVAYIDGLATLD